MQCRTNREHRFRSELSFNTPEVGSKSNFRNPGVLINLTINKFKNNALGQYFKHARRSGEFMSDKELQL
jgi:hypothetical protein